MPLLRVPHIIGLMKVRKVIYRGIRMMSLPQPTIYFYGLPTVNHDLQLPWQYDPNSFQQGLQLQLQQSRDENRSLSAQLN